MTWSTPRFRTGWARPLTLQDGWTRVPCFSRRKWTIAITTSTRFFTIPVTHSVIITIFIISLILMDYRDDGEEEDLTPPVLISVSCPLHQALREKTWPDAIPAARKLHGGLEDLRRTAAFVEETGGIHLINDERDNNN
ncbi:uncharacterized protein LOC143277680 [Babylonia areolata]|uniref:uncharacterized protein LOC143277680 n=1 Tax=Babylonia areolata TaxID=304850 RepID=UPI003FD3ED3B